MKPDGVRREEEGKGRRKLGGGKKEDLVNGDEGLLIPEEERCTSKYAVQLCDEISRFLIYFVSGTVTLSC